MNQPAPTREPDDARHGLPPLPALPAGWIFGGLVGGFALGTLLAIRAPAAASVALVVAQPVGDLWLNALRTTIVPLVVALLFTGIAQTLAAAATGVLARRAVIWIVVVCVLSALLGGLLTPALLWLWPIPADAARALAGSVAALPAGSAKVAGASDVIASLIPTNIIAAASNDAMLPVILFTSALAVAAGRLVPAQRSAFALWFEALTGATLVMVGWILRAGPVGVFALSLAVALRSGTAAIGALAHYVVVVSLVGTVVFVAAWPVARLAGRTTPGRFTRALLPAHALALSTQSSIACLPAMLGTCRSLGLASTSAELVLPLALALFRATGPAMNYAVAIYVGRWWGVPLDSLHWLAGLAVASVMSFGAVSLPGAISYISSIGPIAYAMGVPIEPLALLVAVEMLPDLMRTLGNVTWDVTLALVVDRARSDAA